LLKVIDRTHVDYFQGITASRNRFGIRVEEGHCCAIAQIGNRRPFTFGKHHPLPLHIEALATPLANIVENHMLNDPTSDLRQVLQGQKTVQEVLNPARKIEPKRVSANRMFREAS